MNSKFNNEVTLAITGASGSGYAIALLSALLHADIKVFLVISDAARIVLKHELQIDLSPDPVIALNELTNLFPKASSLVIIESKDNWFSPIASGSSAPKNMVICPCSMGTLASISQGMSSNLLERAADVILKERGKLIVVPRETPLSQIHLENMLKLTKLGAVILPAMPGFYNNPETIDDLNNFIVARILDNLGIPNEFYAWMR